MSLALGLGSSIASGVKSKNAAEAALAKEARDERLLNNAHAQDEQLFNMQYYQDFMNRTEIQDLLRQSKEQQDSQRAKDVAQAAVTGATPEQQLAAQEVRGKSQADMMAGIARNASVMKDSYLNNYQNQNNRYVQNMLGIGGAASTIYANQAAQLSQAGTNAFTAGANQLGSGIDKIVGAGTSKQASTGQNEQ